MEITHINTIDKKGGAAIVAWNLKKQLELKNHRVTMFVRWKYSKDKNVIRIPKNPGQDFLIYFFANDLKFSKSDWILQTKQFREADIVHCHNLHSNFFNLPTLTVLSKLKPVVWTIHDLWPITGGCTDSFSCRSSAKKRRLFYFLWDRSEYLKKRKREIYAKCQNLNIVAPSNWMYQNLKKSIFKNHSLYLIANGVDTKIFKKRSKLKSRKKLKLPVDKKIVLFVAVKRENKLKGWEYVEKLAKLFRQKNVVFLCIGSGNKNLKKSKNILNRGYIKDPKIMAEYLSSADLLLNPSLADSFNLVSLEAMACGLPVVAFNTDAIPEIVLDKKNGYIAKYQNLNDLAGGINYFLKMPEWQKRKFSNNCVARIRKFYSLEKMTKNYLDLYEKLLK